MSLIYPCIVYGQRNQALKLVDIGPEVTLPCTVVQSKLLHMCGARSWWLGHPTGGHESQGLNDLALAYR
jgi:hypothetical protein